MNNYSANVNSGRANLNASRFIPAPHEMNEVSGYNYNNFVQDLFYCFMLDKMEYTNEYTVVHKSVLEDENIQDCINYGLDKGYIWMIAIDGTPLTYIEIVNPKLAEDLLYTYVTDYVISQGIDLDRRHDLVEENVAELKETYRQNVISFISALQSLTTTKDVYKPFGVACLGDSDIDVLDKKAVPAYRVSISKFMAIIDRLGLRPIGVWSGRGFHRFTNPRGMAVEPLTDVRVNKTLSCIFFKGIHLKRSNIRDYSELESTAELG